MAAPYYNTNSTKLSKTYSRQTVTMVGYATITFCYNPDGQFVFPLIVWMGNEKTEFPWIELLPEKSIWDPR